MIAKASVAASPLACSETPVALTARATIWQASAIGYAQTVIRSDHADSRPRQVSGVGEGPRSVRFPCPHAPGDLVHGLLPGVRRLPLVSTTEVDHGQIPRSRDLPDTACPNGRKAAGRCNRCAGRVTSRNASLILGQGSWPLWHNGRSPYVRGEFGSRESVSGTRSPRTAWP